MTDALISARILHCVAVQGLTLRAAFDVVLGAGHYDKTISELYDALRAREVAR